MVLQGCGMLRLRADPTALACAAGPCIWSGMLFKATVTHMTETGNGKGRGHRWVHTPALGRC